MVDREPAQPFERKIMSSATFVVQETGVSFLNG